MDQYAQAQVLWINTNPHNPTGQLLSRASLEPLLARHRLVICDEAFLPLVPEGERQTLIPLAAEYPNLVVIRSLTKLFAVAGLRLGYAIAAPERLQQWSQWRDPWPVNGLAPAAGTAVMADQQGFEHWQQRQHWVRHEGAWLQNQLRQLPGLNLRSSSANYLLVEGQVVAGVVKQVAQRGVLLRDCRSFEGPWERWLRNWPFRIATAIAGSCRRCAVLCGISSGVSHRTSPAVTRPAADQHPVRRGCASLAPSTPVGHGRITTLQPG